MNLLGRMGLLGVSAATLGTLAGLHAVRSAAAPVRELYADEDFDALTRRPSRIVATEDGVELAVREVGPAGAPLTVVFVHGYCLRMQSWHLQLRQLERRWGSDVRMVFYDQRGHGESGTPDPESCTITQLGRDLGAVIDATAATGPVVLIGHSMGGMTILSLARQRPELFDSRIVGVGLLSTTAAGLNRTGLGRNLDNPVIDGFRLAARTSPGLVQRMRGVARAVISPILRAASYGTVVSPRLVQFSEQMLNETSVVTIVNFLHTLELHDESAALRVLANTPALVVCGDADMVIPFDSARTLAAELPRSELIRVRGAGHLVQLEFPGLVSDAIDRLVQRAQTRGARSEQATLV